MSIPVLSPLTIGRPVAGFTAPVAWLAGVQCTSESNALEALPNSQFHSDIVLSLRGPRTAGPLRLMPSILAGHQNGDDGLTVIAGADDHA